MAVPYRAHFEEGDLCERPPSICAFSDRDEFDER
jgi:hypothetical protein